MLYAKMGAIAVFAFGFAAFLIFLFSGQTEVVDEQASTESIDYQKVSISHSEIVKRLVPLVTEQTQLVASGRPSEILNSPYGQKIVGWFNWSEKAIEVIDEIDWFVGFFGKVESVDSLAGIRLALAQVSLEVPHLQNGVVVFREPVSDSGALRRFRNLGFEQLSADKHEGRLLLKGPKSDGLLILRLDQRTFLFGTDEILALDLSQETFVDNIVFEWVKQFESEPLSDDLILVSEYFPSRPWLGIVPSNQLRYSILNSKTRLHFNFSQSWLLVCQLSARGQLTTGHLKLQIKRCWSQLIHLLMGQIRYPEPEDDLEAKKASLRLVKSLRIGTYSGRVIIGVPESTIGPAVQFIDDHRLDR